jgi:hypothetical protein
MYPLCIGTTHRIEMLLIHLESMWAQLQSIDARSSLLTLVTDLAADPHDRSQDLEHGALRTLEVLLLSIERDKDVAQVNRASFVHFRLSELSSSLARHYLRVIFHYFDGNENDDEDEDIGSGGGSDDDFDKIESNDHEIKSRLSSWKIKLPPMFQHQDVGAAVHQALVQRLWFSNSLDKVQACRGAKSTEFLARAFTCVQFAFEHAVLEKPLEVYIKKQMKQLQNVCARLERFHLDDEAHLFPLADIAAFTSVLQVDAASLDFSRWPDLPPPSPVLIFRTSFDMYRYRYHILSVYVGLLM